LLRAFLNNSLIFSFLSGVSACVHPVHQNVGVSVNAQGYILFSVSSQISLFAQDTSNSAFFNNQFILSATDFGVSFGLTVILLTLSMNESVNEVPAILNTSLRFQFSRNDLYSVCSVGSQNFA
jgi:hypothetical protein